jgi:fatty acid desaturase
MSTVLKFIGLIAFGTLILAFGVWVVLAVLAFVGMFAAFFLTAYIFDLPIKVTQNDQIIGTYRRSTGFVRKF